MQKRLVVISYHTCPLSDDGSEIGGMNIYVLELSKELVRQGYVIDIFTRSQNPKSPRIVQVMENLRVIHLTAGIQKYLPPKKLFDHIPEFLKNYNKFVDEENAKYDILSCHYYLSGIIGLEIKRKYSLPMLMTFHTLALMKNLVARGDEEKETVQRIDFELQLVKSSDKLIATSENDAEYLATLYDCSREKIGVLIPGIDLKLFHPIEKEIAKRKIGASINHRIILFAGRIEPLKGIDVLLYAVKILVEKYHDDSLCLWIVGGNVAEEIDEWSHELQKLETLRKLLNITTSVRFVGRKEQKDLPYYYSAAELVVMPSHYEAFGMTALEAMSCGTPVIATDATGVSGLIDKKHKHLVTSSNNPLMLSEKMHKLLSDKNKYKKISKEVYENVQDLSWTNVAKKFRMLCKQCQES
ncbi:MAG TPA: glycosyltransferase [Candidatus Limnocylindrales bacterium]|nr:glycosyltransferase [Candidatus Limnocylindrales bacterium]